VNNVAATSVVVVSATSITATTPAGTAGAKSVAVTTAGGTATKASAFTYVAVAVPTISTVSPTSGPTSGGTSITISGTNFTGATSVTVNNVAATSVVVVSATSITARTPAGTIGAKSVAVTTAGGTATKASAFTYTAGFTDDATTPGENGNSSGDAVASKRGNGNDTSAGQSTSAELETVAAAPMGVELYLQTVALHADANVVCHDAADTTNEIASDFVGPLVSEQVSESNNALLDTSVALSVDANAVAEISAAIDLDHNGVADICQLRGGDLDLDGAITQRDMSILLNMIGLEPVFGIGDMDGNGVLDAADVGMILNQLP
ncbi:MAG: IPT/TIG domain-containing protein, partial [Phycisphaerae bacterium]